MPNEERRGLFVRDWRPVRKNSLRGFAKVELQPIGLVISDVVVHESHGRVWAAMPAQPQLENGSVRIVDGKNQYKKILEWKSRDLGDRFSDAVIAALDRHYPDWRGEP